MRKCGHVLDFGFQISYFHSIGIPLAVSASYSGRVQTVLNFCLFGKVVSLLTLVHCPVTLFHTSSTFCWQLADGNFLSGVFLSFAVSDSFSNAGRSKSEPPAASRCQSKFPVRDSDRLYCRTLLSAHLLIWQLFTCWQINR